jgi:hypothetical protein
VPPTEPQAHQDGERGDGRDSASSLLREGQLHNIAPPREAQGRRQRSGQSRRYPAPRGLEGQALVRRPHRRTSPCGPLQPHLTMREYTLCSLMLDLLLQGRDVAEMLVDKGADDERRNKGGLTANDMGLREARREADLEDDKMAGVRQVHFNPPFFPWHRSILISHSPTPGTIHSPTLVRRFRRVQIPLSKSCIPTSAPTLQQTFQCATPLQMMDWT